MQVRDVRLALPRALHRDPAHVSLHDGDGRPLQEARDWDCVFETPHEANNEDEVEWQRRRAKRMECIERARRSSTYIKLLVLVSTGEINERDVPQAPQVDDNTLSKRGWETVMYEWREQLRGLVMPFSEF